jgi:hypothetical protein
MTDINRLVWTHRIWITGQCLWAIFLGFYTLLHWQEATWFDVLVVLSILIVVPPLLVAYVSGVISGVLTLLRWHH